MENRTPGTSPQLNLPQDIMDLIQEKLDYEKKLVILLEDIKQAALGIDPQSKMELRILKNKVIAKLQDTNHEIREIIKTAKTQQVYKQESLYDE
jgi:hypothetical protein